MAWAYFWQERSVLLRKMCGRYLGFSSRLSLPTPSLPTFGKLSLVYNANLPSVISLIRRLHCGQNLAEKRTNKLQTNPETGRVFSLQPPLVSGAPNDDFLPNALKRCFRLSGVLLKLCRLILGCATKFLSVRFF